MPQTAQTLKNHTRFLPAYHFFAIPVLILNVLNSVRHVWNMPVRSTWFELLMAAALLVLGFTVRVQVLSVQDRVIRLEMRLRLRELLTTDLRDRIHELSRGQLVALRFAGDGELPSLVREVLAGSLTTAKAIKERVKDWQADYLRA